MDFLIIFLSGFLSLALTIVVIGKIFEIARNTKRQKEISEEILELLRQQADLMNKNNR